MISIDSIGIRARVSLSVFRRKAQMIKLVGGDFLTKNAGDEHIFPWQRTTRIRLSDRGKSRNEVTCVSGEY